MQTRWASTWTTLSLPPCDSTVHSGRHNNTCALVLIIVLKQPGKSHYRKVCSKLYFRAEAQQIDRILEAFAKRYWQCNPKTIFGSAGLCKHIPPGTSQIKRGTQSDSHASMYRYRLCCRVFLALAQHGFACRARELHTNDKTGLCQEHHVHHPRSAANRPQMGGKKAKLYAGLGSAYRSLSQGHVRFCQKSSDIAAHAAAAQLGR